MDKLDDLTAKCIRCGFCFESCPTFSLTGSELESPRGRIYLVKTAAEGKLSWEDAAPHLDRCLGCRACETACPSGVEYGKILEIGRSHVALNPFRKLFLQILTSPTWLKFALKLKPPQWFLRRLRGSQGVAPFIAPSPEPRRKWPSLSEQASSTNPLEQVVVLEGCAMRTLFPSVNEATFRVLKRLGREVLKVDLGCCGALHGHSGQLTQGHQMAHDLREKAAGMRVVSNSAGCGSWLRENGIPTLDVSELLSGLPLGSYAAQAITTTYHDACHLAHGQKITVQPRDILKRLPGVNLVEMEEANRCCGSAGAYNVFQPDFATKLVKMKSEAIVATRAEYVIMGNPGCQSWISQHMGSGVKVMHLVEFVEAFASGIKP